MPLPVRAGDPHWIGEYLVTARLGEGGQGIVYLCASPDGRKAAVKLLHRRFSGTAEGRRLFTREIEAAGRVSGYTARVLASGEQGGRPYIVSEYIEGESVQHRVDHKGPYQGAELLMLAAETASALAAIHDANLVHCDFKPANILIGPDGARVIDFGVVRALDTIALNDAELRGTPAYMAPEQITGKPLGRPTDVFAWASTMVFAATGKPPFGDDDNALISRITNEDPVLEDIPFSLREILKVCLRKDSAGRPTAPETVAMLRPRAPSTPSAPKQLTGHTRPITCIAAAKLGDRPIAVTGSQDQTARIWDLTDHRQLGSALQHDSPVLALAFASAENRRLLITGCQDHSLNVWDLTTGTRITEPLQGHRAPVQALSAQGALAVSVGNDRTLLWDLTEQHSKLLLHNNSVMSASCCRLDGRPAAVTGGAWDRVLRIVDLTTGRFIGPPLTGHENTVTSVTCGEFAGRPIAVTGSYDRTVRVWDLSAHQELGPPLPHPSAITSVALDAGVIVTGAADRHVRAFDLATRHRLGAPLTMDSRAFVMALADVNGHPTVLTSADSPSLDLRGIPR